MTSVVTSPAAIAPRYVRDVLEPWCAVGASGALRVFDPPGGIVYLTGGYLTYAECPVVAGVDRLLIGSGRVPPAAWQAAVARARNGGRVGDVLIEQKYVTSAQLELLALSALFGAALFLLGSTARARFEPGVAHTLGSVRAVTLETVSLEVDRRQRMLGEEWDDPGIDTAALLPVRRIHAHHVALTALQWEILANADRRHSPLDLARLLGRDTFAMLLDARRLARAGLIEVGRPGESAAVWTHTATLEAPPTCVVPTGTPDPPVEAEPARPEPDRLPRRHPRPTMPPRPMHRSDPECPEGTLLRIRQALREM